MNDSLLDFLDFHASDHFEPVPENIAPADAPDVHKICGLEGTAQEILAIKVLDCFLIPAFGLVGVICNSFFISVLKRSGLQEPTDIFLFTFIIADLLGVVNNWNFSYILYFFGSGAVSRKECVWEYDYSLDVFFFVSDRLVAFISEVSAFVVSYIPVVITSERFLAVYFPLKCKRIVTKKSAKYICIIVFLVWIPYSLFTACMQNLITYRLNNGKYLARQVISELMKDKIPFFVDFCRYGVNVFYSWLPNVYVIICCILISVKLKMVMKKRTKLFRRQNDVLWSPRTTRTLLLTCIVFAVNHISCGVTVLIFQNEGNRVKAETYLKMLGVGVITCTGTPLNFLIYITYNKKLWNISKQLVTFKRKNIEV